jgi:hypothetical protein
MLAGMFVTMPPPITLSAPHDDVTGSGDLLGAAVVYTVPFARNIRLNSTGDTAEVAERYSKNGGAAVAFGANATVAMANGDTLAIGFSSVSSPGTVTVTVTDTLGGRLLDTLVLTVT